MTQLGVQGLIIITLSWVSMTLCYFLLYPMSKSVGSSTGLMLFVNLLLNFLFHVTPVRNVHCAKIETAAPL